MNRSCQCKVLHVKCTGGLHRCFHKHNLQHLLPTIYFVGFFSLKAVLLVAELSTLRTAVMRTDNILLGEGTLYPFYFVVARREAFHVVLDHGRWWQQPITCKLEFNHDHAVESTHHCTSPDQVISKLRCLHASIRFYLLQKLRLLKSDDFQCRPLPTSRWWFGKTDKVNQCPQLFLLSESCKFHRVWPHEIGTHSWRKQMESYIKTIVNLYSKSDSSLLGVYVYHLNVTISWIPVDGNETCQMFMLIEWAGRSFEQEVNPSLVVIARSFCWLI